MLLSRLITEIAAIHPFVEYIADSQRVYRQRMERQNLKDKVGKKRNVVFTICKTIKKLLEPNQKTQSCVHFMGTFPFVTH